MEDYKNDSLAYMFQNSELPFCVIRVELDEAGNPADLQYLYCNQAMANLTGIPTEKMTGQRFSQLFPDGDRKWPEHYYAAAYEKKASVFKSSSAEIHQNVKVSCLPMEEEGQCAVLVRNTKEEDTYRQRLERQVVSFQNIHEALSSGAWNLMFNEQWEQVSVTWSDAMRKMLGFQSEADFPNTFEAWQSRLHPGDRARTMQEYDAVIADTTGKKAFDVDYRLLTKAGEYHWFHAAGSLSRRADGSPESFDGVFVNVDEKYRAEERYRMVLRAAEDARQEAELESEIISAVSRLYFAIYRIDLRRDFFEEISADRSVHRLTGHEGKAQRKMNELCRTIVESDYRGMVHAFFDLSTLAERLADTDTVETEYLAQDGNWHEARFIEKKRDGSGRVTHVLYVTRIVSKQKQQELERERLKIAYQAAENANKAKTAFLMNMPHDIRTPMNAILGYTQLLRKEVTTPEAKHYQEMIEQSGNLLLSIINNVLDMARIESGKLELDENYSQAGSIVSDVCKVIGATAEKKGLSIVQSIHVEHSNIMCDKTKLEEIFTNLISNSVKYTPAGGQIKVSVQELPCEKEGYACFRTEVEDNGIGMSKEFLPHLFDSFARERNTTIGKVAGTGLGMAIVKGLVELMGGSIEVASELGKGTKFTITLTHKIVDAAYYREMTTSAARENVDFTGKHVLLAEDNDLNAEIAAAMLEGIGFTLDRAEDGIVCVEKLEHQPAGTYDVILMDIQMPNMDGYKAARLIRRLPDREKANIPIIAMTANAFSEDRARAIEAGMNDHIAKPVDTKVLVRVLQKYL